MKKEQMTRFWRFRSGTRDLTKCRRSMKCPLTCGSKSNTSLTSTRSLRAKRPKSKAGQVLRKCGRSFAKLESATCNITLHPQSSVRVLNTERSCLAILEMEPPGQGQGTRKTTSEKIYEPVGH